MGGMGKYFFVAIVLCGQNIITSHLQDKELVVTRVKLPSRLQLKTIDDLYPIIKHDHGIEALAAGLESLNINQPLSAQVVQKFQAGIDVQGLTVLQLAVLYNRLGMVEFLLKRPEIEINETKHQRATLDLCDFYNVPTIANHEFDNRVRIRTMLQQHGALHSKLMSLSSAEGATLFAVTLKKLEI